MVTDGPSTGTDSSRATRCSTSHIYLCMQDNAATFLENKPPVQQKAFSRHTYIHKTCYKFFSEVKDSHKQQMSHFTIFWPAVLSLSNCQQWTLQQAKRVPESKELKAKESTITYVCFQYCSTGFTLTSNKEPTRTKAWVLGIILCTQKLAFIHVFCHKAFHLVV